MNAVILVATPLSESLSDGGGAQPHFPSDRAERHAHGSHLGEASRRFIADLGARVSFPFGQSAPCAVLSNAVLGTANPFEIGGQIVSSVAIQMIDSGALEKPGHESASHKAVDVASVSLAFGPELDLQISAAVRFGSEHDGGDEGSLVAAPRLHDHRSADRADAAERGDLKRVPGNLFPNLIHPGTLGASPFRHKNKQRYEYGSSPAGRQAAAVGVRLAEQQPTGEPQDVTVVNPPDDPVPTTESKP